MEQVKKFPVRTDLAVEERERFPGDGGEVSGVSLREWREKKSHVKFSEVKILDQHGAEVMRKPCGTYLTLEASQLAQKDEDYHAEVSEELGNYMKQMIQKQIGVSKKKTGKNWNILVAGLGNPFVTPDALGPKVLSHIQVTRHLGRNELPVLSGIVPGVMAQTGMETAEIIKGVIREIDPDLLIVIDALAARSIRRLGTTIQMTDTGIRPGSGVGNHRHSLTQESLGIPVLAIGVPTVVGAAAIVQDTVDTMIHVLADSSATKGISKFVQDMEPEEQYCLIQELLEPEFGSLYVTPPNIDETIEMLSYTISEGIHRAVFDRK